MGRRILRRDEWEGDQKAHPKSGTLSNAHIISKNIFHIHTTEYIPSSGRHPSFECSRDVPTSESGENSIIHYPLTSLHVNILLKVIMPLSRIWDGGSDARSAMFHNCRLQAEMRLRENYGHSINRSILIPVVHDFLSGNVRRSR